MDYDAIDRAASQCVLTCVDRGTRFYISVSGCATDIPARAKRYRDSTTAALAAIEENNDPAWGHFGWARWEPMPAIGLGV